MRALFESRHARSLCALRSDRGDRIGKRRRGGNPRRSATSYGQDYARGRVCKSRRPLDAGSYAQRTMNLKAIKVVAEKEFRDGLRDRRSLRMLLGPLLFGPLVVTFMFHQMT